MAETRPPSTPLHPLHAILLAFPLALFVFGFLFDLAYFSTTHFQWVNFASWMNAGGLLMGAIVALWALVSVIRSRRRTQPAIYFALLIAMWLIGFLNALVHGRAAFGSMPLGLYLSAIVALLALAAAWIGYSGGHAGDAR